MAKSDKRVKITLECTECKERNYITMKSKINDRERLEMKKYCKRRPAAHGPQGDSLTNRRGARQGVASVAGTLATPPEGSSSVGRASVSKTDGRGFESLLPCPDDPNENETNECRSMT